MQKKPILYDLVALVFPRVIGWAYAEGHAEGHAPYEQGRKAGYFWGKADAARSMMMNISTWYDCSAHVDDQGFGWYDVTFPKPEAGQ